MNKIKAKIKFLPNSFEVIEKGDYVICAVSKKIISFFCFLELNINLYMLRLRAELKERYLNSFIIQF